MKNSILLILCLIHFLLAQAQTLNVKEKSGSQSNYVFSDIKKLTFAMGNLNINKKDGSISSYAISGIQFLNFTSPTGISDTKPEIDHFGVYPNPAHDKLTISYPFKTHERVQIDILGVDGKVFYSQSVILQPQINQTINVSAWQGGIYLIRLNTEKGMVTKKFIKN